MVSDDAKKTPEASSGLELSSFDTQEMSEAGSWMTVFNPETGEDLPEVSVLVFGEDSKQYSTGMNSLAERRAQKSRARRDPTLVDYDDVKMTERLLAAHVTGDWKGIKEDGVPLDCTRENKNRVFRQHRWLAQQILAHSRDRGNFIAGS